MKQCSKCGETHPLSQFTKNRHTKDGMEFWCKTCKSEYRKNNKHNIKKLNLKHYLLNRDSRLAYQKQRYQNNKDAILAYGKEYRIKNKLSEKDYDLKKYYGIGTLEKDQLILLQDNKCLICEKEFETSRKTHVDHDHDTGEIRGILCHNCNTAIGLLKEDIKILANAIQYLAYYKS